MKLTELISSGQPETRNLAFDHWVSGKSLAQLQEAANELEDFRRQTNSLYEKVRALVFLSSLHRFHIAPAASGSSLIPYSSIEQIRSRHFEKAVQELLSAQQQQGSSAPLSSALGAAYRGLAFETLADQVRQSVRQFPGNQWMFRAGHQEDYPLRLAPALLQGPPFPVLHETTPVRMDLSHSAWSDIFFLAMDYPEGARVLNISVDLAVGGSGQSPRPPVETFLRVIDQPVLRLVSVDLGAQADITSLEEIFDFAGDYLGLLKAALIASGLIPAGLEGSGQSLGSILARLTGRTDCGLELVSQVNDIPKGSRFAVSTNLLASLISVCMRATRQIRTLTGPLEEKDRRQVAVRAILGEWLGGSGGGWQDSGGVWPGIKLIQAVRAKQGDQEFGISQGCLLPQHTVLTFEDVPDEARRKLEASLVLVHGGMSQDVGPVLEMCTERYLLRSSVEWTGRQQAVKLFDQLVEQLKKGDIQKLGQLTQANFDGPIQTIIPWAGNAYTSALIEACREMFGSDFWGFWMLGGMSGGGMGFLFAPQVQPQALAAMPEILAQTKMRMQDYFPFAIEPLVYDFAINENGTVAELCEKDAALLSPGYYLLRLPADLRLQTKDLTPERRRELSQFPVAFPGHTQALFERLIPREVESASASGMKLQSMLDSFGFDSVVHEQLRSGYRTGQLGLAQNRLPANTVIEDVKPQDVAKPDARHAAAGRQALADGSLAIVTMAGGVGSRWTKGAGVVKALHPFHKFGDRYTNFIEIHLAKTSRSQQEFRSRLPHVVTTSYLTHQPISQFVNSLDGKLDVRVSQGRSIGLRMIPMLTDLRYLWEVLPQQQLDEQKQKMRESGRAGLLKWVQQAGEASDYTENLPSQCIHPVGHWYEIPNLLRNGVLRDLIAESGGKLQYLLLHNVDTLGASADAELLGAHIASGAAMTVEVIRRQLDDHGGGLARVNGKPRLVEGLSLPSEEIEFALSYYNTGTYWITIGLLLKVFGLVRDDLSNLAKVDQAVRRTSQRMPSYVTIKDVKKRWGRGQEDVFPVAQFERLWGDMTALDDFPCQYVEVPRRRGQQLKDVAQLDAWVKDGSAAELAELF